MYKRILVPVDGSRFSEQILPHVACLQRQAGVEVALLRVVDKEEEKPQVQGDVESLARNVQASAICTVGTGGVARAILDEAARVPGTLVAISSHGRSGLMRAILGSTALDVLRTGQDPILVFRPEDGDARPAPAAIGRIVVPLDGSPLSESMLPMAAELARWIGARVVIASVIDPAAREGFPTGDVVESSYAHVRASQLAQRYNLDVGWEVLHGDPKVAIPSFVRSLPDTMLAMTTRGRSALQSAIVGSVTAASLRDSGVLVFTRLP